MARIAGVDLPREKRIEIGLTYIYGIGRPTADKLLAEAGVNPDTRVRDITDDEVKKISEAIEKLGVMVEGDLRREIALNIRDFRKSAAIVVFVIVKDFLFVVRRLRPTQELVRDLSARWQIRRSN